MKLKLIIVLYIVYVVCFSSFVSASDMRWNRYRKAAEEAAQEISQQYSIQQNYDILRALNLFQDIIDLYEMKILFLELKIKLLEDKAQ